MDFVAQIIREFLMQVPGAFVRWLFLRKKRSFKSILEEDSSINAILSISMIILTVIAIKYLITN